MSITENNFRLVVNKEGREVNAPFDMPLLWVLRNILVLTGTKFGCGMVQSQPFRERRYPAYRLLYVRSLFIGRGAYVLDLGK
jgi:hypothetical protein